MNYTNTIVRYERNGDKVTPIRVTKQWVSAQAPPLTETQKRNGVKAGGKMSQQRFMAMRSTIVRFGPVNHGPDDWSSSKAPPVGRAELMAQGLIRPPSYESLPCLKLDDPSTWVPAVGEKGPPWSDENPYEIGAE